MTDRSKKLSELTALTVATANDAMIVVANVAGNTATRKLTVGNLFANVSTPTSFNANVSLRGGTLSVNNNVVIAANGMWMGSAMVSNGSKGEKGDVGTNGIKGDKGAYGADGAKGDKGEQGIPGTAANKGDKGEKGDSGPTGNLGPKGDTGPAGSAGITGDKGIKGDIGPKGDVGPKGDKGARGAFGGAAFVFTFLSDTANTDPGIGKVKLNTAQPSTATKLFIDHIDLNLIDATDFLETVDDSTSPIKGHFEIVAVDDPTKYSIFAITGTHSKYGGSSGWYEIPITFTSGSNLAFTNDTAVSLTFTRTGDVGPKGDKGEVGNISSGGSVSGSIVPTQDNVYTLGDVAARFSDIHNVTLNSNTVNANTTITNNLRIANTSNAPASATATGTTGEVRIDQNFIYVCVNTNTWKRAALSSW
jgi:hypothetical protein